MTGENTLLTLSTFTLHGPGGGESVTYKYLFQYLNCVLKCYGICGKGVHQYQKGIDGGERAPSKGGKSLTELPSSGGMRHKLTATRRGFLCPKMQNVHFYEIRGGYNCFDLAAQNMGIYIKSPQSTII